jgi:glycerophosphoryl diester phosphodiesterase
VKEEGEKVYEVLRRQLAAHADILTRFGPSGVVTGAVTVVISGDRAVDRIAADTERLCAVDGRLEQLTDGSSSSLYPLMSDSWPFRWRGKGAMPADEVARLRGIVAKAHEQGRRVRFWGGPEELSAWKVQKAAGVDILNTDHLAELGAFLRGEPEPKKKVVEDSQ